MRFETFSKEDVKSFEPAMKIGILATVNPQGLPHVTMISTLKAAGGKVLCWGQFMEGLSKANIRQNPKCGWMIMTLARDIWRGKARFSETANSGEDFDFYNNVPLFRYNAYFGVHTVYYMDLVAHTGKDPLPMNAVVLATIKTMLARMFARNKVEKQVINPWTQKFLGQMTCLKFLSYIDEDGFPLIIPAIQAQALDPEHVIFAASPYAEEMKRIPIDCDLAVFGLALTMEDVLLRGKFEGWKRHNGIVCGSVKINWVYNPMPPTPMQVYPEIPLRAVTEF
jgi:hypothetical protein